MITPLPLDRRTLAGLALLLAVMLSGVWAWAFTCDDAWISFRYARNLVEGHGLTWNPEERVEGYTNFLWVLLNAGGMALGLSPEAVSWTLGTLSGLGVLALVTAESARRWGPASLLRWLPPALLVVNRSFQAWCTGGLATQLFSLLVLGGALQWMKERREGQGAPWRSSLLLALATLTRPEGGLFTAALGLAFLVAWRRGRTTLAALLRWCLPWFLIVGPHFLWRYSYYGLWWPNTFYAKVGGLHLWRGLEYLAAFAWIHLWYASLALVIAGLASGRGRLLAALALTYTAYIVSVGGDHIAYRFMVPVLPMAALLSAEGAAWLLSRGWARLTPALAATAVLATGFAQTRPFSHDAIYYIKPVSILAEYSAYRSAEGRLLRRMVEDGRLPPDLVLSAGGIGALGYFSELTLVDFRGLTDPVVTRQHMVADVPWVGHELLASREYLAWRRAEIIDVLNRLVHEPAQAGHRSRQAVTRATSRWEAPPHLMPVLCLATEEGALIFATTATPERQEALFGGFETCAEAYGNAPEGAPVHDAAADEP